MDAEVIAIGDELTSGQRLDTNSQWLSQRLGEIGIRTLFHTTVADDLTANIQAFQQAVRRAEVVICTGGLGPTADDLTREALSQAFDLPLELDQPSLDRIRHMFSSRGREMPERNSVQAWMPAGSQPVFNPHGTAPGIAMSVGNCQVFALPGVPVEMKEMWSQSVLPALGERIGEDVSVVRHFRLKCFGTGESALEEMLPDLIRRGRDPSVGITVSKATITLRITAHGPNEQACWEHMQPTIETVRECLGDLVYGEEDDELEHAVTRLLVGRRQSLAVTEWGSGGMIADWLHSVDGSESVFVGANVVNSAAAAQQLIGVDAGLEPHQHAKAMASMIRDHAAADYGLAIGRFPDSIDDPKARFYVGLASQAGVIAESRRFAGHPDILKVRAAKQALDFIRLHLIAK